MDQNLERFLDQDPLGKLFELVAEVRQPFLGRLALRYPNIGRALSRVSAETRAKLAFKDEASIRQSAEILGVSFEELKGYFDILCSIEEELTALTKEAVSYSTLRRSGGALLHHSPVTKIKDGKMPADSLKPYIVYWSGDWCFPCQLTKPTFARLSRFFDRCSLYYCVDDELRRSQGVRLVPQLVAYFPDGGRVFSRCGTTTRELWDNLNLLITVGRGFSGEGTLVCSDGQCRIEPTV